MYRNLVKNLFIGKSKLEFIDKNTQLLPDVEVFEDIMENNYFPKGGYSPDIQVNGIFHDHSNTFVLSSDILGPLHCLYITGIPKNTPNLDFFRLKGSIWSSYHENNHRGYLFQILPITLPIELAEQPWKQ